MTCAVSVVIPAFREVETLAAALTTTAHYLESLHRPWEILVVDDGSPDETAAVAEQTAARLAPGHIRVLRHPRNLGKGAAVRTGVLASAGDVVLFCDADGATPIAEFGKLAAALDAGADVAVGSRRVAGANIQRHQPWLRESLGACYTRLANLLVAPGITDITCGFKAFRRAAALDVFSHTSATGWSFDAELFHVAHL